MHFVMLAFNNHAEVLHSVTPIDLLAQSAVLSDGMVHNRLRHQITQITHIDLLVQSVVLFPNSSNEIYFK